MPWGRCMNGWLPCPAGGVHRSPPRGSDGPAGCPRSPAAPPAGPGAAAPLACGDALRVGLVEVHQVRRHGGEYGGASGARVVAAHARARAASRQRRQRVLRTAGLAVVGNERVGSTWAQQRHV